MIICLNEESNIERCLKSLSWVDEIVVYDSGSKDQTVAIAQKMGAKVYQGEWLGFGPTKYLATSKAQNQWILSVDADEAIPLALQQEIQAELKLMIGNSSLEKRVYKIPRLSNFMGKWIRHGGWYPDYQIRLFNRQFYQWNQAAIHEKIEALKADSNNQSVDIMNQSVVFKNPMHHYVFKNIAHQVQTNNRYSTLQAETLYSSKKKFNYFHFFTKPYVKFIECYFFKLGFLDGWPGYVIARNAAYSVFLKWVKLKEMYDQDNKF